MHAIAHALLPVHMGFLRLRPRTPFSRACFARAQGASCARGLCARAHGCLQDMELHELRLQRDQAQVQARRLKDRLAELFGPEAGVGPLRGRAVGEGCASCVWVCMCVRI